MNPDDAMTDVAKITDRAGAAACFGAAVSAGEHTVIPVADVSYGFGFGWGGGNDPQSAAAGNGGAAGGGARSRGVAVIDVSPSGVRILPIEDQTSIRLAGIAFAGTALAVGTRTLLKMIGR